MAVFQEGQLGQKKGTTTAASLISGVSSRTLIIKIIDIVDLTGVGTNYAIYHDKDGTTYDSSTIVARGSIASNASVQHTTFMTLSAAAGNIGILASAANGANFTAHGVTTE